MPIQERRVIASPVSEIQKIRKVLTMIAPANRKWWIVAAMSLPIFILTVDFFGITIALPSIGHDLKTSTTGLEWTVNSFMLAFAAPLMAVGRLGDIIGRRKVLLIGTVIFGVGSALCGIAENDWWLIASRAVQGLGCSMFFANSLSIVSNAFPADERGGGYRSLVIDWDNRLGGRASGGRYSDAIPILALVLLRQHSNRRGRHRSDHDRGAGVARRDGRTG
jgi:MFS family permease